MSFEAIVDDGHPTITMHHLELKTSKYDQEIPQPQTNPQQCEEKTQKARTQFK